MSADNEGAGCVMLTFFCILLSFGSCYVGAEHCGKHTFTSHECGQTCGARGVAIVSSDTCVCRQGGDQ
jgi:hypothetical protein